MKIKGYLTVFLFCFCLNGSIFPCAVHSDNRAEKTIILNFDDGPRPKVLKDLLPLLESHGARAHFFMMGAAVLPNKKLVAEMSRNGHRIENHGWGHENFVRLYKNEGEEGIIRSLTRAESAILSATGRKPEYFRPPCWEINGKTEKIIAARGYRVMKLENPDINTMDYDDCARHRPPQALIDRVNKLIANHEKSGKFTQVLVFHELPVTVEALKTLIPQWLADGYRFGLLDEKP